MKKARVQWAVGFRAKEENKWKWLAKNDTIFDEKLRKMKNLQRERARTPEKAKAAASLATNMSALHFFEALEPKFETKNKSNKMFEGRKVF